MRRFTLSMRFLVFILVALVCVSCGSTSDTLKQNKKTFLYVGSFTDKVPGTGIHVYSFDQQSGKLTLADSVTGIINPSFLKITKDGSTLYACTDTQLETHGSVSAYRIEPQSGRITLINKQSTGGRNPVHLAINSAEDQLAVAMYNDPSVSVFKIQSGNGSLQPFVQHLEFEGSSIDEDRQQSAHIHSTNFSPDGDYLYAQDLGSDKIHVMEVTENDAKSLKTRNDLDVITPAGTGPRHFDFHPSGKFGYGLGELNGQVTVYRYNQGLLTPIQSVPSSERQDITFRAADIHCSPDGKFLYTSNRDDENSIGIFAIDQNTGKLSLVGHEPTLGEHPRNFTIDPTGSWLLMANQISDSVVVFKRDSETGLLEQVGEIVAVKSPASLQMVRYKE